MPAERESRAPVGSSAKNQFGSVDQGSGAGAALFLTAGNLIGKFMTDLRDAQPLHDFGCSRLYYALLLILQSLCQLDIFLDGQGIQQIIALKYESQVFFAELSNRFFRKLSNVQIIEIDVAAGHMVDGSH